jgi:hypothetical protein
MLFYMSSIELSIHQLENVLHQGLAVLILLYAWSDNLTGSILSAVLM